MLKDELAGGGGREDRGLALSDRRVRNTKAEQLALTDYISGTVRVPGCLVHIDRGSVGCGRAEVAAEIKTSGADPREAEGRAGIPTGTISSKLPY